MKQNGMNKNMKVNVIYQTARCVTIEVDDGSIYAAEREREIYLNGSLYGRTRKVISSIYGLKPDTTYEIRVKAGKDEDKREVRTSYEFVTLNVKDFGAKGDGIQDDTHFIQAAIASCPEKSRVLIPRQDSRAYRTW